MTGDPFPFLSHHSTVVTPTNYFLNRLSITLWFTCVHLLRLAIPLYLFKLHTRSESVDQNIIRCLPFTCMVPSMKWWRLSTFWAGCYRWCPLRARGWRHNERMCASPSQLSSNPEHFLIIFIGTTIYSVSRSHLFTAGPFDDIKTDEGAFAWRN